MADVDIMRQRITWDSGADPLSSSDYSAIVGRVGSGLNPAAIAELPLILQSRHIVYWHNAQNMPTYHNGVYQGGGDCGQADAITSGQTLGEISQATRYASIGASAGASIGGQLSSSFFTSGFGTALKAVPIAGAIASVVLAPLSFISANHAKAIAVEQGDLCSMANAVNVHLDDIDNQFNMGNISQAQASQALQNLKNGAMQIVQPVYKECNAACYELHFLDGLIILRTDYLYPKSHPITAVTQPIANAITSPSAATVASAAKSPLGLALLAIAGIVIAKKVIFT